MGQGPGDFWESAADDVRKRWHDMRTRAVAEAEDDYQHGVRAYKDAIRRGQKVVARTPQEVRALGATVKAKARNAIGAANAGVRSAGNAISLGLADNADAATGALFGRGGPGDFGRRYQNQLAEQHAADRQAAREHPFASRTGEVLGTLGGIFAADAPAVAGVAARMLPEGIDVLNAVQRAKRIGFIPEGLGTMSAVGGGTVGGAIQLASDAAQGRRTSLQDFLGAVGGGVVAGAGAVRRGPVLGAAAGGASTALLQGEDPDSAMRAATASAYGGRILGTLGEQVSSALPSRVKGDLGERLTFAKSWARGEPVPLEKSPSPRVAANLPGAEEGLAGPQIPITLSNGRTTIADWNTYWGRALEAKFGVSARLKGAQRLAPGELGSSYRPDHWLPSDIGNFAGGWLGPAVGPWAPDDGTPR
jgi:hypothetical protein